jgi:YebC/PmpR family DNA-binding regulatory protein
MSGHSKWATIKRKKGAADAKRGKMFTRSIHEIMVAVKEGGGGDPTGNPRLRFAIDKAKSVNMPGDTIERAIKRATGEIKGEDKQDLTYEGYGPAGAAVIVDVSTENKNRTVGEIRHAFTKSGGALGENNCVSWMFDKKGVFLIPRGVIEEDPLMELALESGAEDVKDGGEFWEVLTEPTAFHDVRMKLDPKVKIESAEITMIPKNTVSLEGEKAAQMMRLLETLEDLDDVLNVSTNADLPDAGDET